MESHRVVRIDYPAVPPEVPGRQAWCSCGANARLRRDEVTRWMTLHRIAPELSPAQLATLALATLELIEKYD